jgi:uncharacterized protein (TIGR03084 family)
MMVELAEMVADLEAESADLDRLVGDLPPARWEDPTPSPGWTIAHQIAHLAWTDNASLLAATDPDRYGEHLAEAMKDPQSFVDRGAREWLAPPDILLTVWRDGRAALIDALVALPPGARVFWYGNMMSAPSMATARIMETWAHGLDVADTLGVTREPTVRLRHIAYLGYRTIGHSFLAHERPAPTDPVAFVLTAPDGSLWTYGDASVENRVTGPALDLCLLVTQRRHRADLALTATGPVADEWLDVAQAFAGPPGTGREPTDGHA